MTRKDMLIQKISDIEYALATQTFLTKLSENVLSDHLCTAYEELEEIIR